MRLFIISNFFKKDNTKMKISSKIILFSLVATVFSERVRYDNYQVYRIIPETPSEVTLLLQLENSDEFKFWNDVSQTYSPVDVMVAPDRRALFEELSNKYKFRSELVIDNVQTLIDKEAFGNKNGSRKMDWNSYHKLNDIYDWLDELESKHKEVKVVIAGKSYEGRDIRGIEINFGKNLTGVVIEAGIHAREWIGPAGTTWMINEILNSTANSVFRKFNYLYFPIYNPDGYVHSWDKDRLWRKTRTPYKSGFRTCHGADPNRNWGVHWNEGGASSDPCKENYNGPKAFSEVEVQSVAEYLKSVVNTRKNDIYISYHSYSQLLMFPWGYTSQPAKLHKLWQKISDEAAADLTKVHGTKFRTGQIFTTIYQVSGTSSEWYYHALNATIPFVYEMRDTGQYGFMLPANQIIPSGQEHLVSLERILIEYRKIKAFV